MLEGRKSLGEAVALDCSRATRRGDVRSIKQILGEIVDRNDDLLSAALRTPEGKFLAEIGNHRAYWAAREEGSAGATHMLVPIMLGKSPLGNLEFCFRPADRYDPWGLVSLTNVSLMAFLAVAGL